MSGLDNMKAALLLDKFQKEELRRLTEKADLMRSRRFDDRARWSDNFWRKRNGEILEAAKALIETNL